MNALQTPVTTRAVQRWTRSSVAWLWPTLLTAAAYYISGRLGLMLAIPPGYATAIWPPAGIALAAALLGKHRVLPGIWLGSFALNLAVTLESGAGDVLVAGATASSLAFGATLQAFTAALLLRRFVGFPTSLIGVRDIAVFSLLGGPVGCMVGASWGVATLYLQGMISQSEFLFSWWTWWVGDTMGVLVITPLVVIWGSPSWSGRARFIQVGAPMLLVLTATVVLFAWVSDWEIGRQSADFRLRANELGHRIDHQFHNYLDTLHSVASLYACSESVTSDEFGRFTLPIIARYPGILGLSWNECVDQHGREAFEAAARDDGISEFHIQHRDEFGHLCVAEPRSNYVVVRYIEPFANHRRVLGLDVLCMEDRRNALELARDSGQPTVVNGISLAQHLDREDGVLIFHPVYEGLPATPGVADRRRHIRGYITGILLLGDALRASLGDSNGSGMAIQVEDVREPSHPRLLYASNNELPTSPQATRADFLTKEHDNYEVQVGDRKWRVTFRPTRELTASQRSWEPWLVLAAGLLFTSLLGVFLLIVTGERLRTEELVLSRTDELAKSNNQLEAVLNASTETSIIAGDTAGLITVFNTGAERLLGYSAEEMIGKKTPEAFHLAEEVSAHGEWLTKTLGYPVAGFDVFVERARRGGSEQREWTYIAKDGSHRCVNLVVTAQHDANGQVVGFLGVATDLTEKKRAHEALVESKAQLQLALDNSQHGMWTWDVVTGCVTLDDNWHLLLGYDPGELPLSVETWDLSIHPEDREHVIGVLNKHLASGDEVYDVDYRSRCKDGSWKWVNSHGQVDRRDVDGKPLRMMGTMQDISHRKATEASLAKRAEELARSNSELEQFAYVASHDLREPLRMVQSFCTLLSQRYKGRLDHKADEYIGFAVDGANRMQCLVDGLLEFSRVGRCDEQLVAVPLNDLVQSVMQDLDVAISETGAYIEVAPLPVVRGDAARLAQVLQNLIGNALKFCGNAPPIVRVSANPAPGGWQISVTDEGIGIDPKHFQRLFVIFQRLHTRDEYQGTGIGLALSKRIIEHHGGEIWVESELGCGTSFHFRLLAVDQTADEELQVRTTSDHLAAVS